MVRGVYLFLQRGNSGARGVGRPRLIDRDYRRGGQAKRLAIKGRRRRGVALAVTVMFTAVFAATVPTLKVGAGVVLPMMPELTFWLALTV